MTTDLTTVSFAQGTAPVGDTAVFEIYIKATPERIWEAITDPAQRAKYSFGVQTHSDWTTGSSYRAGVPGLVDIAEGENLVVDPPRLLVQSFSALWSDDVKAQGTTRVTWEIEPVGDSCRLTVVHDQLPDERERRALRRLADDPLRPQDAAGDRRAAHHAGLAHVRPGLRHNGRGSTADEAHRGRDDERHPHSKAREPEEHRRRPVDDRGGRRRTGEQQGGTGERDRPPHPAEQTSGDRGVRQTGEGDGDRTEEDPEDGVVRHPQTLDYVGRRAASVQVAGDSAVEGEQRAEAADHARRADDPHDRRQPPGSGQGRPTMPATNRAMPTSPTG